MIKFDRDNLKIEDQVEINWKTLDIVIERLDKLELTVESILKHIKAIGDYK